MDFARYTDDSGEPIVKAPERAGEKEAGIDFYVPSTFQGITLTHGQSTSIHMAVHVNIPDGYALVFFNKSGVPVKKGLRVGSCVIDQTYQGELILNMFKDSNAGGEFVTIVPNEKLIQGLILPINYSMPRETSMEDLYPEVSQRGDKAFGSGYKEVAVGKKDEAMEKMVDTYDDAKELVSEKVDQVGAMAGEAVDRAGELTDDVKEQAGKLFGKAKGFFGKKSK